MALLLAAVIFLIPSNLFLKFLVPTAYVNGLLIDYVLPKIYVSDLALLALLSVWFWRERKVRLPKIPWPIVVLCVVFVARQFWAEKPMIALFTLLKYIEFGGLFAFLSTHQKLLRHKIILFAWCAAIVFQSVVAIGQFATQSSLFHSYLFLGEPNLTDRIGIAKMKFGDVEKILPYGTTAHPNVLAGFLVIALLIVLATVRPFKAWLIPILLLGTTALLLTESVAAYLAFVSGLFFLFVVPRLPKMVRKIYYGVVIAIIVCSPLIVNLLALRFPNNPSFTRRDELNHVAVQMITHQPIFGVGLQNFTANVEQYSHSTEVVRFVQPAHNVFLLWSAETGLVGVLLAVWLIRKRPQLFMNFMLALFPLLIFDHYMLSLQTGMLLSVFFFTSSLQFEL